MWLKHSAMIAACWALFACDSSTPTADDASPPPAPAPATAEPPPAPAEPAPALGRTPAPEGARAYIVSPSDGATVTNPVRVVFGLEGMGVVPAGIEHEDAGHHHLLIDTDLPPLDLPVPADDQNVHFGGGQTETEIMLEPGTHTLRLLLGDHLHIPHDPPVMSEPVTIQVQP